MWSFRRCEKEQKLFEKASVELRIVREESSCLEQRVCDLEGSLGNAHCQLRGRTALLEEMKGLLDQRASRIKHLEKTRDQLSLSMETELLNGSCESLVTCPRCPVALHCVTQLCVNIVIID